MYKSIKSKPILINFCASYFSYFFSKNFFYKNLKEKIQFFFLKLKKILLDYKTSTSDGTLKLTVGQFLNFHSFRFKQDFTDNLIKMKVFSRMSFELLSDISFIQKIEEFATFRWLIRIVRVLHSPLAINVLGFHNSRNCKIFRKFVKMFSQI